MKAAEFSAALGDVKDAYIQEALTYKPKKTIYFVRAAVAACLCIAILGGLFVNFNRTELSSNFFDKVLVDGTHSHYQPTGQTYEPVMIDGYRAIYYRAYYRPIVFELDETVLGDYLGKLFGVSENYTMYYPEGMDHCGWLVGQNNEDGSYALFYFKTFTVPLGETYSYSEVLKTIYKIEDAREIESIGVYAIQDNNWDIGKEIQQKVGKQIITDENDISEIYRILNNTEFYGWGYGPSSLMDDIYEREQEYSRFVYSFTTEAVGYGAKLESGETTYGNRRLVLYLKDGSMIPVHFYSALFGGFYQGDIVTKALADEDVYILNEIFNIE